jgi:hypothetical protein
VPRSESRQDDPPGIDGLHLDHDQLVIEEDDGDRSRHPERVHAPATRQQERFTESRWRVVPQTAHPFAPALRDEHAPPATGPLERERLHDR